MPEGWPQQDIGTGLDMEIEENVRINEVKVFDRVFKKPSIYPMFNLQTDTKLSV